MSRQITTPEPDLQRILRASSALGMSQMQAAQVGLIGTDEGDKDKYRRFGSKSDRDLSPLKFNRVQEMAFYQWQRYPFAKRMIEILVDFLVGEGFGVKIRKMKRPKGEDEIFLDDQEGQQVWDDFYEDPINSLDTDYTTLQQDRLLNGELVLPAFVGKNGFVRIGYMDPKYIKEVVTQEKNAKQVERLMMNSSTSPSESFPLQVIRFQDKADQPDYGRLTGETFYFRTNYVITQTRGHSELMELLDWIDGFEQFLFGVLDGFDARNTFFYDVEMEGMTQDELDAMAIAPPERAGVNLHNERSKWEVKAPDLKSVDASEAARLIKNFIIGSKGYPEHWFADGGNTNNATAQVMTIPTTRMIKRKQAEVKHMTKFIAQFVLDQALIAKQISLGKDEYFDIEVSMFDFERKDSAVIGSSFVQLVTAATLATSKGWMSDETGKKVVDGMLSMLGIEVDPNEKPEDILKKNRDRDAENGLNPPGGKRPSDLIDDDKNEDEDDASGTGKDK